MERPGGQSSDVKDLLGILLSATRPTPASSTITGRPLLSLLESQMKGNFKAVEEHGETKLQFPDYDPKMQKEYLCRLASANRSIHAAIASYHDLFNKPQQDSSFACDNLPIAQLVEKFKDDAFAEVDETELKNVQISRFLQFFMNGDLQAHLQDYKKIKDTNTIIFNRLALHTAMASGDAVAINERSSRTLTIAPVPPLEEFIRGLRRNAHAEAANCGKHS
jgi:hypothetical protein